MKIGTQWVAGHKGKHISFPMVFDRMSGRVAEFHNYSFQTLAKDAQDGF